MHSPEWFQKRDINAYLVSIGAFIIKPVTYGQGKSGAPDLICCYDGKFIAIEVKRPGKSATAIQERRMEEVRKAGGTALCGTAEKVIMDLMVLFR